MKKKYCVTWNKIVCCQSVVEADTEEEAIELALNGTPDQTCDGGEDDVGCEPTDEEYDD